MTDLNESAQYVTELEERLAALEWAMESTEWRRLTVEAEREFSREGLRQITELSRVMHIKNPLIQRGVEVQKLYVWGQGWTVKAINEDAQAAIDAFLYDNKNDDVFGGHEARMQLEVELATDGNLFFAFFVNRVDGRIRIRTIPFSEIEDVICNPDDAHEPWYYKRLWSERKLDMSSGTETVTQRTAYYPDWRYTPTVKPPKIGSHEIKWDVPIYHVKVGGFGNWRFGLSEVYAAIDWASAYKSFLEDWATITRAYARFAWNLKTPSGSRAIAAAKAKLNTTLGQGGTGAETNPSPVAGSTFIAGAGTELSPIRTAGATVSAEDGRRLLLMVAAASGLPETFYGDSSVGTLATAKSLDRPTELKMLNRQRLWSDVAMNILEFVRLWAVKAPQGALRSLGAVERRVEDGQVSERVMWHDVDEANLSITFPPLLQHDIAELVSATVQAATLGAQGTLAGTMDLPTLSRVLLTTLGVPDAEEIVDRLFPDGEVPEDMPPDDGDGDDMPDDDADDGDGVPQVEAMMIEAVRELRDRLMTLQESE